MRLRAEEANELFSMLWLATQMLRQRCTGNVMLGTKISEASRSSSQLPRIFSLDSSTSIMAISCATKVNDIP